MTKFGLVCSITGSIVLAVMALALTIAALIGLICVLLLWFHYITFDSLFVKIAIGELIVYIAIGIVCAFKFHPLYLVAWGSLLCLDASSFNPHVYRCIRKVITQRTSINRQPRLSRLRSLLATLTNATTSLPQPPQLALPTSRRFFIGNRLNTPPLAGMKADKSSGAATLPTNPP